MKRIFPLVPLSLTLIPSLALSAKPQTLVATIPMAKNITKTVKLSHGLILTVRGIRTNVIVNVKPDGHAAYPRHCFSNLTTWEFHGPATGSVLAWQFDKRFSYNGYTAPSTAQWTVGICGFPLQLVYKVRHVAIHQANKNKSYRDYFTRGTLTLSIESGQKSDLGNLFTR